MSSEPNTYHGPLVVELTFEPTTRLWPSDVARLLVDLEAMYFASAAGIAMSTAKVTTQLPSTYKKEKLRLLFQLLSRNELSDLAKGLAEADSRSKLEYSRWLPFGLREELWNVRNRPTASGGPLLSWRTLARFLDRAGMARMRLSGLESAWADPVASLVDALTGASSGTPGDSEEWPAGSRNRRRTSRHTLRAELLAITEGSLVITLSVPYDYWAGGGLVLFLTLVERKFNFISRIRTERLELIARRESAKADALEAKLRQLEADRELTVGADDVGARAKKAELARKAEEFAEQLEIADALDHLVRRGDPDVEKSVEGCALPVDELEHFRVKDGFVTSVDAGARERFESEMPRSP